MENNIKAYGICIYKRKLNKTKILLCKSVKSDKRWGFLKGVSEYKETKEETSVREFFEESGIKVPLYDLEDYFFQENDTKDIGIFLVNFDKIKNINNFFVNDKLKDKFLCQENSEVKFFDIDNIPEFKKKQSDIILNILKYLKRKKYV